MANPGKIGLSFEVFDGDELLKREDMSAEAVTIGRGSAAILKIDHEALSDLHAVINVGPDGTVRVADLVGTGDGLAVNGAKVMNAALRTGDTVSFGKLRIVVTIVDEGAFAEEYCSRKINCRICRSYWQRQNYIS